MRRRPYVGGSTTPRANPRRLASRVDPATDRRTNRRLATGLVALGLALAANSLLGPLVAGLVEYPFSETLVNQTIGLEAVSLLLVAPWCAAAAILVLRNHRAGPVLAVPPSAFTVYMFAQYVVGPQYSTYPPVVPFHLATFVLGGVVLVLAWNRIEVERLPASSRRGERTVAAVLVLLAGFTVSRYLPAVAGILTGAPIPEEFADDPTMYWSILLLDLGVVVPVTVAAGASLLRGAT
jgi:hypothetical protein